VNTLPLEIWGASPSSQRFLGLLMHGLGGSAAQFALDWPKGFVKQPRLAGCC